MDRLPALVIVPKDFCQGFLVCDGGRSAVTSKR